MSYFLRILDNRNLVSHDGRALWNYNLTDLEFKELQKELNEISIHNIDERDATLYFAEWWNRIYNGGFPNKHDIFNSLGRTESRSFTADFLYDSAKRGAQRLGIKWIQKQNTLYFKTLLLQGGIPIKHVIANKSYYLNFLLKLMELRPDSVEDIVLQVDLTKSLPASSRNDMIYENCLAIINSILNEDGNYNGLLDGNTSLKEIGTALSIKKKQLIAIHRTNRPKVFWIMKIQDDVAEINLRIGLSSKYTPQSLQAILNLNNTADERSYQLYINDRPVCTFKKMLNGDYRTDWDSLKDYTWHPEKLAPTVYCLSNDVIWEIRDFIPNYPDLTSPMLWVPFENGEWRLAMGNATNTNNALLIYPKTWQNEAFKSENIRFEAHELNAIHFEGETTIKSGDDTRSFFSNVSSFEWHILSDKPSWMVKSNIKVVTKQFRSYIFNEKGDVVNQTQYNVYYKTHSNYSTWIKHDKYTNLPLGLIDLKIEYNGIIAYEKIYNIGDLHLTIIEQNLDSANLQWSRLGNFQIEANHSEIYSLTKYTDKLLIQRNTNQHSFPDSIRFKLKYQTQPSLIFDIPAPFSGIGLINEQGVLLTEQSVLTINDLHGVRILTTHAQDTTIRLYNGLRPQVIISHKIPFANQPLISYKEELQRLFYLSDAMSHNNFVGVEIANGISTIVYKLKYFSHNIPDVDFQFERKVKLDQQDSLLKLYAVPINCRSSDIQLYSLTLNDDDFYHLPDTPNCKQFVIISEKVNGKQLQPRFINIDPDYKGKGPSERISTYHEELNCSEYSSSFWDVLKAYYNICVQQQIPFSTFDQIRAIARSSELAAKSFFFLGINQQDTDDYIQRQVPTLEQDLGFCFHWAKKGDWESAIEMVSEYIIGEYFIKAISLIALYMDEIKLSFLKKYLNGETLNENIRIYNQIINEARSTLGERVLIELPRDTPHTSDNYGIPIDQNYAIKLLLRAPIAVAESITNKSTKSIWEDSELASNLRRNIQYSQYVAPDLYYKTIYHCLTTK